MRGLSLRLRSQPFIQVKPLGGIELAPEDAVLPWPLMVQSLT